MIQDKATTSPLKLFKQAHILISINPSTFVNWFRHSSPYIHAFRDRTFIISFGGEAVADASFPNLIHDISLLHSLGIRLVLVHGARPQIEQRLREKDQTIQYVNSIRVTDSAALACTKEAAGSVRLEIEALLSMGLANSPMAGARLRVTSGNFVIAKPLGILNGIDYGHTGEIRRIDGIGIKQRLDAGDIVLLSPIGYSPTGEIFNLTALEVAAAVAKELKADKLIYLVEGPGLRNAHKQLLRQLSLKEAEAILKNEDNDLGEMAIVLKNAIESCNSDVRRVHLIDRSKDGGLLLELFTRDGVGTMISSDIYEGTRQASINDVGGILELIRPLEQAGVLVRRLREQLELEIDYFYVVERDGTIIACAALYPFMDEKIGELACLAVHPDYQKEGRGESLLLYIEREARKKKIRRLFVLTTQTAHWFQERGFAPADLNALPVKKQGLYNYQRRSKVFVKNLGKV